MKKFKIAGEFEPQESVLIVWPLREWATDKLETDAVSVDIVFHLVMYDIKVIIICYDASVEERAKRKLLLKGADISVIDFYLHKTDNNYPRDFGAEVLLGNHYDRRLVDFRFVEYAFIPDNLNFSFGEGMRHFNKYHAQLAEITALKSTWIASEGGDREFNGKGVMMAIEETEVKKRNPGKTKEEVEEEFKRVLHLDKVIWIPRATFDDENVLDGLIPGPTSIPTYRAATANGHIDEMCRFVSEDTILIASISEQEASENKLAALNKERLDDAYLAVSLATDIDGNQFKIKKMPVPEPIYIEIVPGEPVWNDLKFFVDANGGKFFDGMSLPEEKIHVLPALSYCNFLITNGLVLAQKYWSEGMPDIIREKDEEAVYILKNLFPERDVIAINTLALNITGGGIHCHTRNIPRSSVI